MRYLYLVLFCLCCVGCKPQFESSGADYSEQPTIPMYSQLMLKGPVKCVTDDVDSRDGEFTDVIVYRFDESRRLIYFEINDREMGCAKETSASYFYCWGNGYAYFCYPGTWTETNSAVDIAPESGDKLSRRIEYAWTKDGVFTDIRFYSNDELCTIESVVNLAEVLYDSNGYPRLSYSFAGNQPSVLTRNTFSELDEFGNPLKIYIEGPNGNVSITRVIEYYLK